MALKKSIWAPKNKTVLIFERKRLLSLGRQDLVDKIKQPSPYDYGDGYYIQSFDITDKYGNYKDRFIEVKTTQFNIHEGFCIPSNELNFPEEHKCKYYLYCIYWLKTDDQV